MSIPSVQVTGVPDPLPPGLLVLDVREDDEWAYGHIEGSLHVPMMEIPGRLHEIEGEQVLVVCKVGARSAQVVNYLVQQGYDAFNLHGGLLDWESAGRPLVSDAAQPPVVI